MDSDFISFLIYGPIIGFLFCGLSAIGGLIYLLVRKQFVLFFILSGLTALAVARLLG